VKNTVNDVVRAEHESLEVYLRTVLSPEQLEKVAIISFSQWELNTATVGEVAATLHTMGTEPLVGLWADKTPLKDVGWSTSRLLARLFMSRARDEWAERGLRALGMPQYSIVQPPIKPWTPRAPLPRIESLYRSAIRQLSYRGAPMGRAILQVHPASDTPITDDHDWPRRWVEESTRSFAWAFDQSHELLTSRQATALVVFNGRFLHDSAATSAALQCGLPVLSFDFGGNDTDFDVTIDHTHDWSALQRRMLTMYNSWDPIERDEIGALWFEERRQHTDPRNRLFTESQTRGKGIDKPAGKRLVVYFSSSGDEISELDLDWGEYFYGQEGALNSVARVCRDIDNTVLVVRTHTHKRHKPKRDVEDWHAAVIAAAPDIHFDEFSEVDSYTLMAQADVVVTYGSTTGVEAAYAERPVVVMGPSAYDELGCATRVVNEEELHQALSEPRVGNRSGALSYGLMMRRRGFTNRFVRRINGVQVLGGVEIRDAHPIVLKLSDRMAVRQKNSLRRGSSQES
jgi:hypothetical protein